MAFSPSVIAGGLSADVVSVIAGGPSVQFIDDPAKFKGLRIGVNDSAVQTQCVAVVSMDRLWTENRLPWLRTFTGLSFIRRSALQNIHEEAWPSLRVFECDHESNVMSLEPGRMNGTSSGMCALNLAFHLSPKRVYLFGFDMHRPAGKLPHWYPSYPWAPNGGTGAGKFREWATQYEAIARQFADADIEVLNCSPLTALTCFPKIHPKHL